MHVYDDINVAAVHESDKNIIHGLLLFDVDCGGYLYIFKSEGILS